MLQQGGEYKHAEGMQYKPYCIGVSISTNISGQIYGSIFEGTIYNLKYSFQKHTKSGNCNTFHMLENYMYTISLCEAITLELHKRWLANHMPILSLI